MPYDRKTLKNGFLPLGRRREMNVKFQGSDKVHQMKIDASAENLVRLYYPFPEGEDLTAGFEVLTDRGSVYGDYTGYTTVYRELEDGVILSSDGSVYIPPAPPEPPEPEPDPEPPTVEEVRSQKLREVSETCRQTIHAGVDVILSEGMVEHFSLKEEDQLNLFGKQAQLTAGAKQLEYHQDGHPCRYYSAADMQSIITAAVRHVSYHTTYCNSLNMWIAGASTVEEVNTIYYGADVPDEYQSEVLRDYLTVIMGEAAEVIENATVS